MDKPLVNGCAARDTLVNHLASLARLIIQAAWRDASVRQHYRRWLRQIMTDQHRQERIHEPLVQTGLDEGVALLLARPIHGEFLLVCEHATFAALVVVGFDMRRERLRSVWLAQFDGSATMAAHFAQALESQLETRVKVPLPCDRSESASTSCDGWVH